MILSEWTGGRSARSESGNVSPSSLEASIPLPCRCCGASESMRSRVSLRLGIAVVYLMDDDDGFLLDLHLHYLKECTQSPYTIYAAANRLQPRFREILAARPEVTIVDIPTTDLRGSKEHAYYLEELVRRAIEDQCTHLATFHVDSFPIRHGWDVELAEQLSPTCPLAAVVENCRTNRRPATSCMMFTREFYVQNQPRFLLGGEERASREYARYALHEPHVADAGVGYGLELYAESLSWYRLFSTERGHNRLGWGRIFDDSMFHLGAAVRKPTTCRTNVPGIRRLENWFGVAMFSRVPRPLKRILRPLKCLLRRKAVPLDRLARAKRLLRNDPEAFMRALREG